ncbi:MAG TPA: hypothetical protein VK031_00980 [Tissierellaceae bacterium]|nr:hypothetical protein [Tissierellaceae bacterium]
MKEVKTNKKLVNKLNLLVSLLKEEREALIKSDGDKVAEIVKKKENIIEDLSTFKGLDIREDKIIMELIKEIDSLQEMNLLLTKQALSFQNALLESISKGVKASLNTYSAKGNYESNNKTGLVDQSV